MQENNQLKVGEKIRNFRKRIGMSQLDLEVEIDASAGSISRIESGEVNPTKETIFKIAEALKSNGSEIAELFGIEKVTLQTSRENTNQKPVTDFNLQKVLNLITSKWVNVIGVDYAVIWLWSEHEEQLKLESVTAPQSALEFAAKAMGKDYSGLTLSMSNEYERQSDYLRCLISQKPVISDDFSTVAHTFITKSIARIIQSVLNMGLTVTIPLILENQRLGVLGLIWKKKTFTPQDHAMMDAFAEQISITIYNAQLLENH